MHTAIDARRLKVESKVGGFIALICLLAFLLSGCAPAQTDVEISSNTATLSGTIYWPKGEGPHPALIVVHGSGPDTRENYRLYADWFARQGFAVLIYDKRGEGSSSGNWHTSPFSALSDDAHAAWSFLSKQPAVAANRVGIWGGSEGAVVALDVAARHPGPAFLILQSPTGVTFAKQNLFQTALQLRNQGVAPDAIEEALRFQRMKQAYARSGQGWSDYSAELQRSRSQPWGALGGPTNPTDWWWAWYGTKMDVNPAALAQSVRIPVFAVWGERDQLVPVKQSQARLEQALARAGNRDFTSIVIPGADHSINTPSGPNPASQYLEAMEGWMRRFREENTM